MENIKKLKIVATENKARVIWNVVTTTQYEKKEDPGIMVIGYDNYDDAKKYFDSIYDRFTSYENTHPGYIQDIKKIEGPNYQGVQIKHKLKLFDQSCVTDIKMVSSLLCI